MEIRRISQWKMSFLIICLHRHNLSLSARLNDTIAERRLNVGLLGARAPVEDEKIGLLLTIAELSLSSRQGKQRETDRQTDGCTPCGLLVRPI